MQFPYRQTVDCAARKRAVAAVFWWRLDIRPEEPSRTSCGATFASSARANRFNHRIILDSSDGEPPIACVLR